MRKCLRNQDWLPSETATAVPIILFSASRVCRRLLKNSQNGCRSLEKQLFRRCYGLFPGRHFRCFAEALMGRKCCTFLARPKDPLYHSNTVEKADFLHRWRRFQVAWFHEGLSLGAVVGSTRAPIPWHFDAERCSPRVAFVPVPVGSCGDRSRIVLAFRRLVRQVAGVQIFLVQVVC